MKTVRKITPVSLYDMPGLEQWLEEMANLGLFPLKVREWTTFRKDGTPGTRFRLEPMGKDREPPQAQLDLYREAGWEYAFSMGRAYLLFYSTDPNAPELHTDWMTKGQALDQLAKRIRWGKWHRILYVAFFFLWISFLTLLPALLSPSRFDVQPDRWAYLPKTLVSLTSLPLVLFLGALLLFYGKEVRDFRQLLRMHRNLSEGMPPPPSPGPSQKNRRWNQFITCFSALCFLSVILHFLLRSLSLAWFPLPYPHLSQVDGQFLISYEEMFDRSPGERENVAEWSTSLLAPVWYTVNQSGYRVYDQAPTENAPLMYSGSAVYYAPELTMTKMVLTIPAMARPVAESVMDSMRLVNLEWTYEELSHPEADFVILGRTKHPWQLAALGKNGKIAVFRYSGSADLADRLNILVEMVQ